jgi:hypothetical protein
MYVEISPRQSGKTTRLIQAASDYLRHNPTHNIAVVGINLNVANDLKNKFIERGIDSNHIKFLSVRGMSLTYSSNWGDIFGMYNQEPDYWFFDEFGYMREENIKHPIYQNIIENAYYTTTPGHNTSTNLIVNHCIQNNIQIHFNNPWTEERIQEQGNWNDYVRESVLGDWVRYMEINGLINGIKENLIRKFIKKHRFTSW